MRAVVCRQGELTVEEIPTPEPGKGQVLLRVLRAGICGSDLHARVHSDATAQVSAEVGYDAFMRSEQSVVMGHEFAGEVVSYGPGCRKRWAPGTPVVSVPMIRHGADAHLTGLSESAPGGYAQFVLVSEDMTFQIPENLPAEHAALTEPMAVAHHAVRRGEVGRRDVAVVVRPERPVEDPLHDLGPLVAQQQPAHVDGPGQAGDRREAPRVVQAELEGAVPAHGKPG